MELKFPSGWVPGNPYKRREGDSLWLHGFPQEARDGSSQMKWIMFSKVKNVSNEGHVPAIQIGDSDWEPSEFIQMMERFDESLPSRFFGRKYRVAGAPEDFDFKVHEAIKWCGENVDGWLNVWSAHFEYQAEAYRDPNDPKWRPIAVFHFNKVEHAVEFKLRFMG